MVLLSSSTLFHLDQLFALPVSRCSFFSCFLSSLNSHMLFFSYLLYSFLTSSLVDNLLFLRNHSTYVCFFFSMKHYSFSVAWFPTLTITFPVHSFHAFTQPFCEVIVDSFYWNFPISLSSFQNFALSLIATSTLPTTSLYSLWAMAFLLTFLPFWQKAEDPTDSFHYRFILSFYFSNVIKFHMCRSIFTTSESILFYQAFFSSRYRFLLILSNMT